MDRMQVCKICENISCGQSYDHQRITEEQFWRLFKGQAKLNIFITDIKNKIKRAFKTLQSRTLIQLDGRQNSVFILIDQLQYWHLLRPLGSIKNIEAILFGYSLPKIKLAQLVKVLRKEYKQNALFPSFRSLQKQLNYVTSLQFSTQQFGSPYDYIFHKFSKIICDFEAAELKKGKHQVHLAAGGTNPKAKSRLPESNSLTETVLIQGIPMGVFKQTLNLSMLQVNDSMVSKYLPAIEKMIGLKEIELRNNRINQFCYGMLFNGLKSKNIRTLDLRNSRLSRKVVSAICDDMKSIQNLYLSETDLQNRQLDMIGYSLKNLKMLHIDKNPISYENVQRLIQNPALLFISLKNTKLTRKQGRQLSRRAARLGKCVEFQ